MGAEILRGFWCVEAQRGAAEIGDAGMHRGRDGKEKPLDPGRGPGALLSPRNWCALSASQARCDRELAEPEAGADGAGAELLVDALGGRLSQLQRGGGQAGPQSGALRGRPGDVDAEERQLAASDLGDDLALLQVHTDALDGDGALAAGELQPATRGGLAGDVLDGKGLIRSGVIRGDRDVALLERQNDVIAALLAGAGSGDLDAHGTEVVDRGLIDLDRRLTALDLRGIGTGHEYGQADGQTCHGGA